MNEDSHVGGIASALVMLAAVATTFTTYTYYKDDKLTTQYESAQVSLDQTASALLSLRLQEEAFMKNQGSSTPEAEVEVELE